MKNSLFTRSDMTCLRRERRKQLSPEEAKLWLYLKNAQLEGRKFRRQHSIGFYLMDFYCPSEKLAVELSCSQEIRSNNRQYLDERRKFLEEHGIRLITFEAVMIWIHPLLLLREIEKHFQCPSDQTRKQIPPPRLSGTPPFQEGNIG